MTRCMKVVRGRREKITTAALTIYPGCLSQNRNQGWNEFMTQGNLLRRAMRTSGEFAKSGDYQQALIVLDEALAQSIQEHRLVWIRLLTGHAVIICNLSGDFSRAKRYCEQCLAYVPDDPWVLYDLANVLCQQGETDLARRHATKSYDLVVNSEAKEAKGLVELLT